MERHAAGFRRDHEARWLLAQMPEHGKAAPDGLGCLEPGYRLNGNDGDRGIGGARGAIAAARQGDGHILPGIGEKPGDAQKDVMRHGIRGVAGRDQADSRRKHLDPSCRAPEKAAGMAWPGCRGRGVGGVALLTL
jgi:hypothetical protein